MAASHHRRMHERQHETVLLKQQPRREVSRRGCCYYSSSSRARPPRLRIYWAGVVPVYFLNTTLKYCWELNPALPASSLMRTRPRASSIQRLAWSMRHWLTRSLKPAPRSFFRIRLM